MQSRWPGGDVGGDVACPHALAARITLLPCGLRPARSASSQGITAQALTVALAQLVVERSSASPRPVRGCASDTAPRLPFTLLGLRPLLLPASKGRFAPWGRARSLPPWPGVALESARFPSPSDLSLLATVCLVAGRAPLRFGCIVLMEARAGGEQAATLPHVAFIPTLTLWR